MKEKLDQIEKDVKQAFDAELSAGELEALRVKYIGRKGVLTDIIKSIKDVPASERAEAGKRINDLKRIIEDKVKTASPGRPGHQKAPAAGGASRGRMLDRSLPGSRYEVGSRHPISQMIEEICDICLGFGFRIAEGPEVETEYYNFTALNIPNDHPSRETFHTFFLDLPEERHPKDKHANRILLRSQTSTVQIRIMEKEKPPLQVLMPGKVYRPDATDASHSFMFHQVEGLMVDEDIKFSDLKGILDALCKAIFGARTKTRFRPHYFPFTEPSAEVDVSCIICGGKGCRVCGKKGWLEILGAGMVNPKVFEAVGYPPDKWSGFAFGMGVERIAMLKWGISDIRIFYENDLRFLRQF